MSRGALSSFTAIRPSYTVACVTPSRVPPRAPPPLPSTSARRRALARSPAPARSSNTSSSVLTEWKVSCLRTSSGMSSMSASLSFGRMMVVIPARCAPSTFSLSAADRQHAAAQRDLARHRHVLAHRPSRHRATRAPSTIAMPADGPSFGIAPAGTWMCTSIEPSRSAGMLQLRRRASPRT